MIFTVDPKIFEQYQDLKIGAITIRNFDNSRRNSSIEGLLRGASAQKGKELSDVDLKEEKMIKVWNESYGRFGINPNKFPSSLNTLSNMALQGIEIQHIDALVDICNYFSLKNMLPVNCHDIDWLCGDLHLTFTKGGEAFREIDSIDVQEAKEGEVAYMDEGGIVNRYWNHKGCERTKPTKKTVNGVILIEDMSKMHMDAFGKLLNDMQNSVFKYLGGQIESYIITEEARSIDLGVEGRKTANDAKVPRQEKAHHKKIEVRGDKELPKEELTTSPEMSEAIRMINARIERNATPQITIEDMLKCEENETEEGNIELNFSKKNIL